MRVFPPEPATDERAYLVCVPERLLPLFCGALKTLEEREAWASEEDWALGYRWIVETQANLVNNCIDTLVESNNQLYRLVDSVFNGAEYVVVGTKDGTPDGTPIIQPDIPDVPTAPAGISSGLRKQLLDFQGIKPGGWPFGIGSRPATIADIVAAVQTGSQDKVNKVKSTIDLLSGAGNTATIFSTVRDFFTDGAQVVEEGGILIALLIGIAGNTAMQSIQVEKTAELRDRLDRLIASLDGGAATRPTGNVLAELQSIDTLLG